jgi:integrase
MRPKSTGTALPPRMLRRTKKLKSGELWVSYYYNGRDESGARHEYPLGRDLNEAKRKWAEFECKPVPQDITVMRYIFDRYERYVLPSKALSTQRENRDCIRHLRMLFDDAPVDAITPHDIARYRDARSAKVRANREIALLSHVFNMAREWGLTQKANPCRGVRKNKERPREFYADREVWDAVYAVAPPELRDAMDLNYLSGQRPADVLKMRKSHIKDDVLEVRQGKTRKMLRIVLERNGVRSELGLAIDRMIARPRTLQTDFLVATSDGQPLKSWSLRTRFDSARAKAASIATAGHREDLAERIRQFQFRDIRSKAASEISDLTAASRLLGHTDKQITDKVYRRVGERVEPTR